LQQSVGGSGRGITGFFLASDQEFDLSFLDDKRFVALV
jgi:hypothetical protein